MELSLPNSEDLMNFVNERYTGRFACKETKQQMMKAIDPIAAKSMSIDDKYDIIYELSEYNLQHFMDEKPSMFSHLMTFKIMLQFLENLMQNNKCPDMEEAFTEAIFELTSQAIEYTNTNGSLIAIFNETYSKNKVLCTGYMRECVSQNIDVTKSLAAIIYHYQFKTNSVIQRLMPFLFEPTINGLNRLRAIGQIMHESQLFESVSMSDIMTDLINYHSIFKHFKAWLHDRSNTDKEYRAVIFRILTQFMKFDSSISANVIQNGLF
eukprot:477630_1